MKKTILILVMILSMSLSAVPLSFAAVNPSTITASYSNSVITYTGTGFMPGSYIVRLLDGSSLKTITDVAVGPSGSFTATDAITLTASSYTIYVNDRDGVLAAAGTLTYAPSSGGSAGGGGVPPATVPGSGGAHTAAIPVTVNGSTGEVAVVLSSHTIDALIAGAIVQSNAAAGVILDLSGIKEARAAVMSREAAQKFGESGIAVTVKLPAGAITLASETLASLAAMTGVEEATVTVKAAVVDPKDLHGMQAAQVKGYGTVVNIDLFVGDKKIDMPITATLPYTLKPGENPAAVRAWHMDDNGELTDLHGAYDIGASVITFAVDHQSYFVTGYEPATLWVNLFSDITRDAWYYDAVAYVNYYGLFAGYGGGKFAPQDKMTRAMFATVLWNLEGTDEPSGAGAFRDVAPAEWYYAPVQWAAENGIVSGVGNGKYAPHRSITRQEMALMLINYAAYKNYDVVKNRTLPAFIDYNETDLWAEAAVRQLSEAGVLNGGVNRELMPTKDASRSEVAQMFKNFLRLVAGDAA